MLMKRLMILFVTVLIAVISLAGCTASSNAKVSSGREILSLEITRYKYITQDGSMKPREDMAWKITDKNTIKKFMDALDNRVKSTSILDIRPRDYLLKITYSDNTIEEFDLWLDKDSKVRGVLMKGEDAWIINTESNAVFMEILK